MEGIYDKNGLIFWNQREIKLREFFRDYFADRISETLLKTNPAWKFHMIEAPVLTPKELVNEAYSPADMYVCGDLILRPETTPGTYQWIRNKLDDSSSGIKTPVVAWQCGKSFRREQDQPTKHVRLKEFYQQEFQCVYTEDTANDYHAVIQEPVMKMIGDIIGLETRLAPSDRIPHYSQKTIDVEVNNGDKWMEVCSISLRTDFPGTVRFYNKKNNLVERKILVTEVAIGLDRVIFNFLKRTKEI